MKTRILVASTHTGVREEARRVLGSEGFEVEVALDAAAAAQALTDGFALAVIDVAIARQFTADGDGHAAAPPQQGAGAPPIVVFTTSSERLSERAVRAAGAVDAITVPFDAEAIVAVVEHALVRGEETAAGNTPHLGVSSTRYAYDAARAAHGREGGGRRAPRESRRR